MKHKPSRFLCPSFNLDLGRLIRRATYGWWIGSIFALVIHLALIQLVSVRKEKQVAKPLTTQFVKRQPRLTKPLELRKRPQPKRRAMRRKLVSLEAKKSRTQVFVAIRPEATIAQWARPVSALDRMIDFRTPHLEPSAAAPSIDGAKEARDVVDMSLEMMDIEALDTGKYQAMVVQDPSDKRNIRGFVHLAVIYSKTIEAMEAPGRMKSHYVVVNAVRRLIEALNIYTAIEADVKDQCEFSSEELFKTPWVLVSCRHVSFQLTEVEATNMGRYMLGGGLLMADDFCSYRGGRDDLSLRRMLKDALASRGMDYGNDWNFEIIPNSHPLYHCYFDFEGPPIGSDYQNNLPGGDGDFQSYDYIEGIHTDGRLIAIMSNKSYSHAWGDWGIGKHGSRFAPLNPARQLQFGINIIVFALTQEGSITRRVMDSVNY